MTFKSFIIGMLLSFGAAWVFIIAVPTTKMANIEPVKMSSEEDAELYRKKVSGRMLEGGKLYAANGCYTCHTQLIRPTTLGRQIWREDMAGVVNVQDNIDTRRETSVNDFTGEDYAQIGLTRMGPDLSNFGYRAKKYGDAVGMTAEQWVLAHLYNPRNSDIRLGEGGEKINLDWSNCSAQKQMFKKVPLNGRPHALAIKADCNKCDGEKQIIPTEQARLLANYLTSLKRDDAMPESMDYSPKQSAKSE